MACVAAGREARVAAAEARALAACLAVAAAVAARVVVVVAWAASGGGRAAYSVLSSSLPVAAAVAPLRAEVEEGARMLLSTCVMLVGEGLLAAGYQACAEAAVAEASHMLSCAQAARLPTADMKAAPRMAHTSRRTK
jgi:hypothetical protein